MNNNDLSIETVTPEIAADWLKKSIGNRRIDQNQVAIYADDMKAGRWKIGNDAVIFNEDGQLRNAHNRLTAVVLSGVTVQMIVRRNVPEDEIPTMDQGRIRSPGAALGDFGGGRFGDVDNRIGAIARSVLFGAKPLNRMSMEVLGEAIVAMREGLDFILKECLQSRAVKGLSAPVIAIMVRMYYAGLDRERLKYAGAVLIDTDEALQKHERLSGTGSLIALKEFLSGAKARGGGIRADIYHKTQNMLTKFMKGVDQKNVTGTAGEVYPIPEHLERFRVGERSSADAQFTIALRAAAKQTTPGRTLTLLELGAELVREGYAAKSEQPEKHAAAAVSRMLRKTDNHLNVEGVGRFVPVSDAKRIRNLRFEKILG